MGNTDPAALARLLDIQDEDTAIRRLEHRRETLPEAQRLAELNERLAELEADVEIARKQQEELSRAQDRLEGEIGIVGQKVEREESRMYSGGVSNPKELSSLQAEVQMLKRQRADLEDELLEVLVQREQSDGTLTSLETERSGVSGEADELGRTVGELTSAIEEELRSHAARRSEATGEVPADLLGLYEQLRDQKGGVGAAALKDGTCRGCHTKLPAREVERLKSDGGVQRCDNCRRILVVT
ncbi:MAG: zinc ribbon domain-containing protein [Actinomycetota bacterium]